MPAEQRALVKSRLSFYHEHKDDSRFGQMRPVQSDILYSAMKVERGRKAYVSYAQFPALRIPLKRGRMSFISSTVATTTVCTRSFCRSGVHSQLSFTIST